MWCSCHQLSVVQCILAAYFCILRSLRRLIFCRQACMLCNPMACTPHHVDHPHYVCHACVQCTVHVCIARSPAGQLHTSAAQNVAKSHGHAGIYTLVWRMGYIRHPSVTGAGARIMHDQACNTSGPQASVERSAGRLPYLHAIFSGNSSTMHATCCGSMRTARADCKGALLFIGPVVNLTEAQPCDLRALCTRPPQAACMVELFPELGPSPALQTRPNSSCCFCAKNRHSSWHWHPVSLIECAIVLCAGQGAPDSS